MKHYLKPTFLLLKSKLEYAEALIRSITCLLCFSCFQDNDLFPYCPFINSAHAVCQSPLFWAIM